MESQDEIRFFFEEGVFTEKGMCLEKYIPVYLGEKRFLSNSLGKNSEF